MHFSAVKEQLIRHIFSYTCPAQELRGAGLGGVAQAASSKKGVTQDTSATFDAVGSIIAAIDGVEKKEFTAAHCVTRPPGFWRLSSLIREAQTNRTSR